VSIFVVAPPADVEDATPVMENESVPRVDRWKMFHARSSGTLSFSITGVASSTSAGGATTNIDTTATEVPFGTLPIGTPIRVRSGIDVSTNASAGFEVYGYQTQGLIGDGGQQINPIPGTNNSPSGWSSACTSTLPGCFGYHTNEAVLAGGSTRFAVDDSYATVHTVPERSGVQLHSCRKPYDRPRI